MRDKTNGLTYFSSVCTLVNCVPLRIFSYSVNELVMMAQSFESTRGTAF